MLCPFPVPSRHGCKKKLMASKKTASFKKNCCKIFKKPIAKLQKKCCKTSKKTVPRTDLFMTAPMTTSALRKPLHRIITGPKKGTRPRESLGKCSLCQSPRPSRLQLCAQGLGLLVWTPAPAGVQTSSPKPCLPPSLGPQNLSHSFGGFSARGHFHIGGPY